MWESVAKPAINVSAVAACPSDFWKQVEAYFAYVTPDDLTFLHDQVQAPFLHLFCCFLLDVILTTPLVEIRRTSMKYTWCIILGVCCITFCARCKFAVCLVEVNDMTSCGCW